LTLPTAKAGECQVEAALAAQNVKKDGGLTMSSQKQCHRIKKEIKARQRMIDENDYLNAWKRWAMSRPPWWKPWAVKRWRIKEPQ